MGFTYFRFKIQLDAINAELAHVDIPLVRLVLGRGAGDLQGDGLSILLLGNSILPQPRLQVLLELTRTRIPHARLYRPQGVALDGQTVQRVEQAYFGIDVTEIIVADLE